MQKNLTFFLSLFTFFILTKTDTYPCLSGDCIFTPSGSTNDIIICTNKANKCTIQCHSIDSCKSKITVYSSSQITIIECFGENSCLDSIFYFGEYIPNFGSYNLNDFNGNHNNIKLICTGKSSCKSTKIYVKGNYLNGFLLNTQNFDGLTDKFDIGYIECNIYEGQLCELNCNNMLSCDGVQFICYGGICQCQTQDCPNIIMNTPNPTTSASPTTTLNPTKLPTNGPTTPIPTSSPITSINPTLIPTNFPSKKTLEPTTNKPTNIPSINPTKLPIKYISPTIPNINNEQHNGIFNFYYILIIIIVLIISCLIFGCLYFKTSLLNLKIKKQNIEIESMKQQASLNDRKLKGNNSLNTPELPDETIPTIPTDEMGEGMNKSQMSLEYWRLGIHKNNISHHKIPIINNNNNNEPLYEPGSPAMDSLNKLNIISSKIIKPNVQNPFLMNNNNNNNNNNNVNRLQLPYGAIKNKTKDDDLTTMISGISEASSNSNSSSNTNTSISTGISNGTSNSSNSTDSSAIYDVAENTKGSNIGIELDDTKIDENNVPDLIDENVGFTKDNESESGTSGSYVIDYNDNDQTTKDLL